MNYTPTIPSPLANAICMHCGYDISGMTPNNDGRVTCPECGHELIRSSRTILSRRNVHMRLFRSIVVLFFAWSLITALLVLLLNDSFFGGLIVMAYVLFFPLALPVTCIIEWVRTHRDTAPFPRPYPRWVIPLWALTYAVPSVLLYIGMLFIMERLL